MKNLSKALLVPVGLLCLISFAYAVHETIPSETQVPLPGADAGKLYGYIVKFNPYAKWPLWPGKGRLYKGREPHGSFLTTRVNNRAFFSLGKGTAMSDGSLIVKENYSPEKKLAALTVMYKIKGYNPAAGDWFWAKYDPYGKVLESGKVSACIKCHGVRKDNDYIMTEKLLK